MPNQFSFHFDCAMFVKSLMYKIFWGVADAKSSNSKYQSQSIWSLIIRGHWFYAPVLPLSNKDKSDKIPLITFNIFLLMIILFGILMCVFISTTTYNHMEEDDCINKNTIFFPTFCFHKLLRFINFLTSFVQFNDTFIDAKNCN